MGTTADSMTLFTTPAILNTNTPNAAKLIDSLRHVGYDNYSAVADLVDNSLDAEATRIEIWVKSECDDFSIEILDDGNGMDVETLDQALRLGSDTSRDQGSDLGRFGMGLITASLSLGRRLEVFTRASGGPLLHAVHDVDDIIATNSFVRELSLASVEQETRFNERLVDGTGTIITVSHGDLITNRNAKAFQKNLRKRLAEVHRYFLDPDIRTLSINGEEVKPSDPLMLNDERTEVFSDETYSIKFTDREGLEHEEGLRVRLAVLPDVGRDLAESMGINYRNQGLYILRNNRQLKAAQAMGDLFIRHNDLNRFRGELFFSGELDEAMGVNFAKGEISPMQAIMDKLRQEVRPQIYTIKNRVAKSRRTEDASGISHTEAEKVITGKAKLLVKPPVEKEIRPNQPRLPHVEPKTTRQASDRLRFTQSEMVEASKANVKFGTSRMGKEGPIYAADQVGKLTLIDWNIDHPFYERFVLENKDNQSLVTAADFLVYSLAVAELRLQGEDEGEWLTTIKSTMSTNLRVLLS